MIDKIDVLKEKLGNLYDICEGISKQIDMLFNELERVDAEISEIEEEANEVNEDKEGEENPEDNNDEEENINCPSYFNHPFGFNCSVPCNTINPTVKYEFFFEKVNDCEGDD